MRKLFAILSVAALLSAGCSKNVPSANLALEGEGTLSLSGLALEYDDATKAASAASGNYTIIIRDASESIVVKTTYGNVKANAAGIKLPAGRYTLEARSTEEEMPAAAFEQPVYGVSSSFSITAGQTTEIGSLTCTLLQCKVTVSYDDAFLATVTGNGSATVTVDPAAPLVYGLTYSAGVVSYEQSAGYFSVNNGANTTMSVVFSGKIEGKNQKMTATITNIEPRQWRQVKFIKTANPQGNATFSIVINSYIDDAELTVDLNVASEEVIGEDPDAPKGDGGITMEFAPDCTMYDDLMNVVVPTLSEGKMDLRLIARVPGGVKKFIVNITSDSPEFIEAVALAGGPKIDLVNPSESASVIFQVVPFTHGSDIYGKTEIPFDLSAAQSPILGFPGEHIFTMEITDNNGCRKSIPVKLIVK